MALCRITGTLYLPSGEPAASYVLHISRLKKNVVADYVGSVVPDEIRVPSNRNGLVDFEILTGIYCGVARQRGSNMGFEFSLTVPDSPSATFESCIDPMPVWISPYATDTHYIKRGDTLNIAGVWLDARRVPIPTTGVTISSSLLGPDKATRALTVTKLAGVGEFELSMASGSTALLPLGTHQIDIKFSTGARVVRTLTGRVIVDQEITP